MPAKRPQFVDRMRAAGFVLISGFSRTTAATAVAAAVESARAAMAKDAKNCVLTTPQMISNYRCYVKIFERNGSAVTAHPRSRIET